MTTTDHAIYVSRRPSWATRRASTPRLSCTRGRRRRSQGCATRNGQAYPVPVKIVQEDMLYENEDGVVLDSGTTVIFTNDINFTSVVEARKYAAAILECCDRLDGQR